MIIVQDFNGLPASLSSLCHVRLLAASRCLRSTPNEIHTAWEGINAEPTEKSYATFVVHHCVNNSERNDCRGDRLVPNCETVRSY
jgi:hypothetical protein